MCDKINAMPEDVRDIFAAAKEKWRQEGRKEGRQEGRNEGVALGVKALAPSENSHPNINGDPNETTSTQTAITNTQNLALKVCLYPFQFCTCTCRQC